MNKPLWYVGLTFTGKKEAFRCTYAPSQLSHGYVYRYCTGPMSKRKAKMIVECDIEVADKILKGHPNV